MNTKQKKKKLKKKVKIKKNDKKKNKTKKKKKKKKKKKTEVMLEDVNVQICYTIRHALNGLRQPLIIHTYFIHCLQMFHSPYVFCFKFNWPIHSTCLTAVRLNSSRQATEWYTMLHVMILPLHYENAYSIRLKISPPKNWKFSEKNLIFIFIFLLKT